MKTIHLSDGRKEHNCYLTVRNMNGTNGERGFRLYWENGGDWAVPARGLATTNPFKTRRGAIAFGEAMQWGTAKVSNW